MRRNKRLLLSVISSLFLVVFSVLIIFFIIFISSSLKTKAPKDHMQEYQYIEVNPFSNRWSTGFVKISEHLDSTEYFQYLNKETGSSYIITNFGGSNFECSGSCYCEDGNSRRAVTASTSHILSRGLAIFFSAFSFSMALNIADETFRDQCVKRFSDDCEEENILSDVEGCVEKNENERTEEADEEPQPDLFHCKGNCVPSNIDFWNTKYGYGMSYGYNGERAFTTSFNIDVIDELGQEKVGDCSDLSLDILHYYPASATVEKVEYDFSTRKLHSFCRGKSFLKKELFPKSEQKEFERVRELVSDSMEKVIERFGMKEKIYEGITGLSYCSGAHVRGNYKKTLSKDNPLYFQGEVRCVKTRIGNKELENWASITSFE